MTFWVLLTVFTLTSRSLVTLTLLNIRNGVKLARDHFVLMWVVTTSRHNLYSRNGQKGQPQQLYSYFQVHVNRGSFILNESIADIITTDISEKVTLGFTDCGP